MADPAQIQQMLSNLQSQLATVQSMAGSMNSPATPAVNAFGGMPNVYPTNTSDVASLLKTMVAAEIASQKSSLRTIDEVQPIQTQALPTSAPPLQIENAPASNVPQAPIQQTSGIAGGVWETLKPIIGAAFTTDQQVWLSHPNNLLGLPGFLMTPDGKAVLVRALNDYQTFVKGGVSR